MIPDTPHAAFTQARNTAVEEERQAKRLANRLALVRLVSFFALIGLVILMGSKVHVALGVLTAMLGIYGFNLLVGRQQALDAERVRQQRIIELNDGELRSLDYQFSEFDDGAQFRNAAHPYTSDLDVFGPNSLFQLLNRTASLVGRASLSSYLINPLKRAEAVEQRQHAVQELAHLLPWRQRFLSAGTDTPASPKALDRLRAWAAQPTTLTKAWWPWAIYGLAIFNVAWLYSFLVLPFYLALVGYAPTFYLLYRAKKRVDKIHSQTEEAVALLARYELMMGLVETQAWESQLLQELARRLTLDGGTSSVALKRLSYLSRQLAVRVNPFVLLLNIFSFWEIRYARALEGWKAEYLAGAAGGLNTVEAADFMLPTAIPEQSIRGTRLDDWLLALGAVDALCSFAGAAFRYPAWNFPTVLSNPNAKVVGEALHHPLLPPARSVANAFTSPPASHLHLLTGSNMAGKSTFLRTVGLHIAMAQVGCPVPAQSLQVPLLLVYTSMRTQDNLHEGASAFYAELRRLRFVVEATQRNEPVFFLLDEILKGTNSQDRHEGGRALIRQLIRNGGAGIIATHDLELGALAEESTRVQNIRLEVETNVEGELYFDYTVKAGLAQSRNASVLMAQMGLGEQA